MATLYFTNSLDSGEGSLRATIASASDGDVIAPDPEVFEFDEVITILLSSYIPITAGVEIRAGVVKRIRLDGQGGVLCMRVQPAFASDAIFSDVDFVRGYLSSFGTNVYIASGASGSVTFNRCLFAGGHRPNAGGSPLANFATACAVNVLDSVLDKSDQTSCIYAASGCAITCDRCDLLGAIPAASTVNATDCIQTTTPEDAGFVAYPSGERTIEDWSSFDLRLTLSSQYISGATTTGVDFERRNRLTNGCLGAYANIRKLESATLCIIDSRATGYITSGGATFETLLCDGAIVFPQSQSNTFVTATHAAIVNGATVTGYGYLALPVDTDTTSVDIDDTVRLCDYGAGASLVAVHSGAGNTLAITRDNPAASVCVEKIIGDAPSVINAKYALDTYTDALGVVGDVYRIFDGVKFTVAVAASSEVSVHCYVTDQSTATSITVTNTAQAVALEAVERYLLMSSTHRYGETPICFARIENSETGTPLQQDDITSISMTIYRYDYANIRTSGTSKTPVQGWTNIAVDKTTAIKDTPVEDDRRCPFAYNFVYEPNTLIDSPFASAGNYSIEYTITPVDGNKVPVIFEFSLN